MVLILKQYWYKRQCDQKVNGENEKSIAVAYIHLKKILQKWVINQGTYVNSRNYYWHQDDSACKIDLKYHQFW